MEWTRLTVRVGFDGLNLETTRLDTGESVRLDDTALGIPFRDRVVDGDVVTVLGRWGGLVELPAATGDAIFAVLRVLEPGEVD